MKVDVFNSFYVLLVSRWRNQLELDLTGMASIGSVFLGDVQRLRVFSTSTPPSSPPASSRYTGIPSPPPIQNSGKNNDNDSVVDDDVETTAEAAAPPKTDVNPQKAPTINPMLALELRLRWLEALVLGLPENNPARAASHRKLGSAPLRKSKRSADEKAALLKHGETLVRLADDVQNRLDAIVEANEGLKRFMAQCRSSLSFLFLISQLTNDV